MRSRSIALVAVLLLGSMPVLAGCSVADNIVGGVVDEVRGSVDDAIGEALGGAGISSDGELPSGFPADPIPTVGEVAGGGSGPNSSGWVVRTTLESAAGFADAQAALEGAGFTASGVDSDAESGFGTFTSDSYVVILTVTTGSDGVATATYVVTPA